MKRYGIFKFGTTNGDVPYHIFEISDIVNNLDRFKSKDIKILAGDLFVEKRSKKTIDELKQDITSILQGDTRGSDNLNDCIGSTPETQYVITVDEFFKKYYK